MTGFDTSEGLTLVQAWTAARHRLAAASIESPVIDARLLLEVAIGHRMAHHGAAQAALAQAAPAARAAALDRPLRRTWDDVATDLLAVVGSS